VRVVAVVGVMKELLLVLKVLVHRGPILAPSTVRSRPRVEALESAKLGPPMATNPK
jgi:hypothetical protein